MSHPRWPGFNHKTGDPSHDNWAANQNRKMWAQTKRRFKITGSKNRKRKKMLTRVEGGKFIMLVNEVAQMLYERDRPSSAEKSEK